MSVLVSELQSLPTNAHIVLVVACLLRCCRAHTAELLRDMGIPDSLHRIAEIRQDWEPWFTAIDDEELTDAELDHMVQRVIAHSGPVWLLARGVAEAADAVLGPRFLGWFRDRGAIDRQQDEPVPVPHPDLRGLLGVSLNSRPRNLGRMVDRVDHLSLLPDTRGLRVTVDTRSADVLSTVLQGPLSVAALLPNAEWDELDWKQWVEMEQGRFFHVVPKDVATQRVRIFDLLKRAEVAGARIALLPELCVTKGLLDGVHEWLLDPGRTLELVVVGSYHDDAVSRRNVTVALTRSGVRWTHDKFAPFAYRDDTTNVDYEEDIRFVPGTSGITVHVDQAWSAALLICKDLLHPYIPDLLACLAPSLVLVPSWSDKTDAFTARAHALCTDAQSIVVVASLVASKAGAETSALACLPVRTDPLRRRARSTVAPPTAILLHSNKNWTDI